MRRLLPLLLACLVATSSPGAVFAQKASSPTWEAGIQTLRVTSQGRTSVGVGAHVARMLSEHWGLRASVRHAFFRTSTSAGFGAGYDRRRIGGSLALRWRPVRFRTGLIDHSVDLRAGPVVNANRATRAWVGICATGLPDDPDDIIERRYPKRDWYTGVGTRIGLGYGLSYRAVTARFVVARQNVWLLSSGRADAPTPTNESISAGMSLSIRF